MAKNKLADIRFLLPSFTTLFVKLIHLVKAAYPKTGMPYFLKVFFERTLFS